jgi:AcrR family transcriptional regulator
MVAERGQTATGTAPVHAKTPRTERGRKTLRALLDAAATEFGEHGFHEGSISGITRRAGVALGTFYTYFDSKDAIFRALVRDMSDKVREHVTPRLQDVRGALEIERTGLAAFLEFVREHQEVYRIIDESEFVDYEGYRLHYTSTVERIRQRLEAGVARGEIRAEDCEVYAWAIGGMNVFLGLRFGLWDTGRDPAEVARIANALLAHGMAVSG